MPDTGEDLEPLAPDEQFISALHYYERQFIEPHRGQVQIWRPKTGEPALTTESVSYDVRGAVNGATA